MKLTLEFGGGLELLCDSVKIHDVNVEPQGEEKKLTMNYLLSWVRMNLIKERPEMFMKGDTVGGVPRASSYQFAVPRQPEIVRGYNSHIHATLPCRRPGVLVLVNDCDWELSGQLETVLEEKDVVVFISTLHGG